MALTLTAGYTWTSGEVDTATKRNSAAVPTVADGQTYAFGLGAAATPSLSFTGDADTGAYSPGANQWAVAVAGVQAVRVDTNGVTIAGRVLSNVSTGAQLGVGGATAGQTVSYFVAKDTTSTTMAQWERSDGAVAAKLDYDGSGLMRFGTSTAHNLELMRDGTTVIAIGSASVGFMGNTPVAKQVSGGTVGGVITGLIALGLFSS